MHDTPQAVDPLTAENHELLAQVLEAAEAGTWCMDLDSGTLHLSARAVAIHGLGQDTPTTVDPPLELVHPDDREHVRDAVDRAAHQTGCFHVEFRSACPPDGSRWLACHGRVMDSPAGRRLVGLVQDITDRKRMERELARSNRDLEQFASSVSHDLQEPLRIVTTFLGLLRDRHGASLDDKAREYIGYAVQGAEEMAGMIRDLLAYSRVQTRGIQLCQTDMNEVYEQAVRNCRASIRKAGATVAREQLPTVRGDRRQLVQLLQNLIANAVKFRRPDTAPEVRVLSHCTDAGCMITVRDNGIGIPPEQHERIFGVFQRLHPRDEYSGTGMGLAICQRIAERHGGTICVESRPGNGSAFSFFLPR